MGWGNFVEGEGWGWGYWERRGLWLGGLWGRRGGHGEILGENGTGLVCLGLYLINCPHNATQITLALVLVVWLCCWIHN